MANHSMAEEPKSYYKFQAFSSHSLDAFIKESIYLAHPSKFNDPLDCIVRLTCKDADALQWISDYLLIHEAKTEEDQHFYSTYHLGHDWARLDNYDEATGNFDLSPPYFSDSFYYALKIVSDREHFCRSLIEKSRIHKLPVIENFLTIYENLGVCALGQTMQDIQMWAYYADNHKGICTEYTVDEAELKKAGFILKPVLYDTNRPVPINNNLSNDPSIFEPNLLCKSDLWKHEQEVRLMSYKKKNCLVKFPGKLKSITFGIATPPHEREIIKNIIQRTKPYVELYSARISHDRYRMHRTPVVLGGVDDDDT